MRYTNCLILIGLLASTTAGAADLRVKVAGTSDRQAPVYLALYDTAESFETMDGVRLAVVKRWTEHPSVAFTDLPPGEYAVAAFQDLNGNQELDTNFMGQPTEPFALSRNARGNMGPPRFGDAAIVIDGEDKSITLELRN
ncbi:MAG: DUF2141 domain-containing protein [Ectothiorhodospiraceae bacterium]|nr:DUF2141 domain-containing protein [Ectothiorhodospiraceae bacterium]MCH8504027.1 DUF2141 domain-containing protein [Ectothiorhodospiraceae bacterium]